MQYAQRQHKTLGECLDETIPMARQAGFKNVELNQSFFTPELRGRVRDLLISNHLKLPAVYVGGPMHSRELASRTMQQALEIGAFCKPLGCSAVINNPNPKPGRARKSDGELAMQAEMLNQLGQDLSKKGFQLWTHNHDPEMAENAREWRSNLKNTDPKYVWFCLDLDWVHQADLQPLELLREAGNRVAALHIRNSRDKLWLESLSGGDIDYRKVADYLKREDLSPLLVVELAYRQNTVVTRPLVEDLRLSRIYAEKTFGVSA